MTIQREEELVMSITAEGNHVKYYPYDILLIFYYCIIVLKPCCEHAFDILVSSFN